MNHSSLVITDDRVEALHGRPALAGYLLKIAVEFVPTSGSPEHHGVSVSNLRADVSCKGERTSFLRLGVALPEQPMFLFSGADGYKRTMFFELMLSTQHLAGIEHARAGGELSFEIALVGEAGRRDNRIPTKQILRHTSNLSEWGRVLSEMGWAEMVVVGIPIPRSEKDSSLRAVHEQLQRAVRDLQQGRWSDVVGKSRMVIEAIWKLQAHPQEAAQAAQAYFNGDRKRMTRRERALFVQEAMRHFAHLAHHVDESGSSNVFSDSDAAFALALASASLAEAAAREA